MSAAINNGGSVCGAGFKSFWAKYLQASVRGDGWDTERGQVRLQSPRTCLPVDLAARFTLRGPFCGVV